MWNKNPRGEKASGVLCWSMVVRNGVKCSPLSAKNGYLDDADRMKTFNRDANLLHF